MKSKYGIGPRRRQPKAKNAAETQSASRKSLDRNYSAHFVFELRGHPLVFFVCMANTGLISARVKKNAKE
jgi:hypothetical protein